MTRNKTTKAAIRARMAKTGERYTTARHHLLNLNNSHPSQPSAELVAVIDERAELATASADDASSPLPQVLAAPDIDVLSTPTVDLADPRSVSTPENEWIEAPGMSDEAIAQGTGERWATWFARLDAWGAAEQPHAAIARHLVETYGVGGWWAQSVTVGYERARGRRRRHEHADGFTISASKTIAAPASAVFAALTDPALRDRWLPAGSLQLRTSLPDRSARFDVTGAGTRLAAYLWPKGAARTSLQLQEERLAPETDLAARKAFWKERLAALAALLATDGRAAQ